MLSRKDQNIIREMIREEFKAALFREITVKKVAKTPGEVDGKIETSTKNLLDQLVLDVPVWVQSLGLMESEVTKNTDASNALVNILSSMQDSIMTMARFALALKETGLLEQLEKVLEIEYINPKVIENETDTG